MRTSTLALDPQTQDNMSPGIICTLRRPATLPIKILLVEDNASDAELTRHALDKVKIPYTMEQPQKGTEVIPYLTYKNAQSHDCSPDLILLDLGLPCEDGFEVLEDIALMRGVVRDIPVVILTGYEHFAYLKDNHQFCITDYLTKPCSVSKLRTIIAGITHRH